MYPKSLSKHDTRDKCRLIQPMKRTTTYGLRSFQYYGAHAWNMLPVHMKAAQSLSKFKSFIKSWPGPTCSCPVCIALLKEISPYILITGDGICRRYGLVVSYGVVAATTLLLFSVFKIHACHRDEGFVILTGFFAGFTEWCLSTTSSVSGGGGHVGMTTFSFQWITTEFFMKSHIYWYLKCYPFLWSYCDKIVFSQ